MSRKKKIKKTGQYYSNCDTLPLDKFISCLIEGDVKHLVIAGEPPLVELAQAWIDIYFEYFDLQGSNDGKYRMQLYAEITVLKWKLLQTELYVKILQHTYREDVAAALIAVGFDVKLDPHHEDYFETLKSIHTRSREWSIDVKIKEAELSVLDEQDKENKKVDKSYFTNLLSRIATYKRVPVIHSREISVAEFCAMTAEYLQHIKSRSWQNSNG